MAGYPDGPEASSKPAASGTSDRTRFLARRGNEAAFWEEGRSFPSETTRTLKPNLGLKSERELCGWHERGQTAPEMLSSQATSLCKQLSLRASLIKTADFERQAAQHALTGKRARAQYQLEAIQTRDK